MAKAGRAPVSAPKVDWALFSGAAILLLVGLMSIFSENHARADMGYFKKQLLYTAIGIIPFCIFYFVKPMFWARIANWLYGINVLSLIAVLAVGAAKKGAERWIDIGPIQFQPSEMAKLLTILTLAAFFARRKDRIKEFSTFALSLLHVAVPVLLILKQPHLGAALVILVSWGSMCVVAGVPFKYIGALIGSIAILGFVVVKVPSVSGYFLQDYQKSRVKGMFTNDDQGRNYQTSHAAIVLGEGGVMGTGYMRGSLKKGYVPEQHNDFIFTIVGEEGGLVGASLLLLAFGFFFYRVWLVMFSARELYYRCIAAGIFAALFFHMFVNIGMVLEILPVVGLWLPFLSYGGTALWLCLACVGLLMSIRKSEKPVLFS